MKTEQPFSQSGQFERAVRGILRPLIRALIAQNLTAPAFYRIVKQTYVEVAAEMLSEAATDSRINVMTGVHRRDVKEFRAAGRDKIETQIQKVSTLSTVVGRWLSRADYLDADGSPRAIPRTSDDGPSFDALVQSVSRDIRPRTVYDELLRQGIITAEGDTLSLALEGLVGPADMNQRLHFFSRNLGDHMSAAVDNLLAETPPHLERAVFYNNLDTEAVIDIENEARQIAADTLRQINAMAAARQNPDAADPDATHRFRFGIFFYKEDEKTNSEGQGTNED